MLKTYGIDIDVAPVRITWHEELVEDTDAGDFYLKVTPTVDWAHDLIKKREVVSDKIPPHILAAQARQKIAEQNRRIVAELKREAAADIQKQLRAEYNKKRGQRWNKRV